MSPHRHARGKQASRAAGSAAAAPCSSQGQALDPRFRGGDEKGAGIIRLVTAISTSFMAITNYFIIVLRQSRPTYAFAESPFQAVTSATGTVSRWYLIVIVIIINPVKF